MFLRSVFAQHSRAVSRRRFFALGLRAKCFRVVLNSFRVFFARRRCVMAFGGTFLNSVFRRRVSAKCFCEASFCEVICQRAVFRGARAGKDFWGEWGRGRGCNVFTSSFRVMFSPDGLAQPFFQPNGDMICVMLLRSVFASCFYVVFLRSVFAQRSRAVSWRRYFALGLRAKCFRVVLNSFHVFLRGVVA